MLVNVDNKCLWFRTFEEIEKSLGQSYSDKHVCDEICEKDNFNKHPYVNREVTNMHPEGCVTCRPFTELDDANAMRWRAMIHAAHMLGFDPYKPPKNHGRTGWWSMVAIPDWRELEYLWEKMFD